MIPMGKKRSGYRGLSLSVASICASCRWPRRRKVPRLFSTRLPLTVGFMCNSLRKIPQPSFKELHMPTNNDRRL